ncbi:hypothetical protein CR513_07504, partial [Mucuna pruriens]
MHQLYKDIFMKNYSCLNHQTSKTEHLDYGYKLHKAIYVFLSQQFSLKNTRRPHYFFGVELIPIIIGFVPISTQEKC